MEQLWLGSQHSPPRHGRSAGDLLRTCREFTADSRVGEPREAAHAILFALTNDYLTGEVLHLDGGARLV